MESERVEEMKKLKSQSCDVAIEQIETILDMKFDDEKKKKIFGCLDTTIMLFMLMFSMSSMAASNKEMNNKLETIEKTNKASPEIQ